MSRAKIEETLSAEILQAVRAEISAMKNLNLAKEVREQKLAEGQEIGKLVLLAEAKLGELFNQMPKAMGARTDLQPLPPARKKLTNESESESDDEEEPPAKPKLEVAKDMGFNKNQVADFQKLADNPAAVQKAIDDAAQMCTVWKWRRGNSTSKTKEPPIKTTLVTLCRFCLLRQKNFPRKTR